jgi:hypothetical protein
VGNTRWTEKENSVVREKAGKVTAECIAEIIGRTTNAVRLHANNDLGLSLLSENCICITCNKDLKRTGPNQKRCKLCARIARLADMAAWQKAYKELHKEEVAARRWLMCPDCSIRFERNSTRQIRCPACRAELNRIKCREWQARNPDKVKKNNAKNGPAYRAAHPEYLTVAAHHRFIFNTRDAAHRSYRSMPFFNGWNPNKGGSFKAGEKWIIDNIGKRPNGSSLHVIHHDIGFVPGNLEWAHPRKQSNQQMYKIIAQQRHRIQELEQQTRRQEATDFGAASK